MLPFVIWAESMKRIYFATRMIAKLIGSFKLDFNLFKMGFNSYNKQTQENMQMLLSFMRHFLNTYLRPQSKLPFSHQQHIYGLHRDHIKEGIRALVQNNTVLIANKELQSTLD